MERIKNHRERERNANEGKSTLLSFRFRAKIAINLQSGWVTLSFSMSLAEGRHLTIKIFVPVIKDHNNKPRGSGRDRVRFMTFRENTFANLLPLFWSECIISVDSIGSKRAKFQNVYFWKLEKLINQFYFYFITLELYLIYTS